MSEKSSDGWFTRRMMRLTAPERRFVNDPRQAQATQQRALGLLSHAQLPPHPTCLELGCGQGAAARLLVEQFGATVTATDYDPDQVAVAQERLADLTEGVSFEVVDAREIPFGDAQFDGVFSFYVLHHIVVEWQQAVAEIARVLKPGGWYIFTDITMPSWFVRAARCLSPRWRLMDKTALRACLAENGLSLVHYEHGQRTMMGDYKAVMRKV